jgi:hypothetical protein
MDPTWMSLIFGLEKADPFIYFAVCSLQEIEMIDRKTNRYVYWIRFFVLQMVIKLI